MRKGRSLLSMTALRWLWFVVKRVFKVAMDALAMRTLPRRSRGAGLMRGLGVRVMSASDLHWSPHDRQSQRYRYWRTTPRLPSPTPRATPALTTLPRNNHTATAATAVRYFSSSSTLSALTSTRGGDVTKQTKNSTLDAGALAAATSDVTQLDEGSSTVTVSSSSSSQLYSTTSSGHVHIDISQQTPSDDNATSLAVDSSSRDTYVTARLSQHVDSTSGSRDHEVSGFDVKAQVADDEDEGEKSSQSTSTGQVMSASPGEEASTSYLGDGEDSTDSTLVPATQVNEAVLSTTGTDEMSDVDVIGLTESSSSSSSSETAEHDDWTGTTSSSVHDDVTEVSETGTSSTRHLKNTSTRSSVTSVDQLPSTAGKQFACGRSNILVAYPICRSVCRSVQRVNCGKMADWIWMPFGVVSGVGRGMCVLDGGGDRQRRR